MIEAVTWAFKQPIKPATRKFVLVALANCAGHTWECWPSVKYLQDVTCLDRKTVLASVAALESENQLLIDTGRRVGKTGQIKVYVLAPGDPKGAVLGIVSNSPVIPAKQVVTVPLFPANSPVNGTRTQREPLQEEPLPAVAGKRAFTDRWCQEFFAHFKVAYVFQGAKDGKAADKLLASGASVDDLMATAKAAWERPVLFNCKQAVGLAGFASRINEIRHEIKHSARLGNSGQGNRGTNTLNAARENQYAGVGKVAGV